MYDHTDQRIFKELRTPGQEIKEMYIKDAMGRDLAVVKITTTGATQLVESEYYVYGTERIARVISNGTGTPSRIYYSEATFFLYDHLGNTRVSYSPQSWDIVNNTVLYKVESATDYTPYGKIIHEFVNELPRYLTTQHERDKETGLDYRGARYYDSDVARFLSIDPWAAKYPEWSTYSYSFCNPIRFIDPDGRSPVDAIGDPPYEKWGKLNSREKNIILWDIQFYKAQTIEKNANTAFDVTKSTFGYQGKGDESDAFRHAYWMALNAQSSGKRFSQKWGDAHEYSTPVEEVRTDLYMDIHNNDVGIEIGLNNPKATPDELKNIVLDRMKQGDLLIINENNKLIKSDGSLIKEGEIRRKDVSTQIATDIINENK